MQGNAYRNDSEEACLRAGWPRHIFTWI